MAQQLIDEEEESKSKQQARAKKNAKKKKKKKGGKGKDAADGDKPVSAAAQSGCAHDIHLVDFGTTTRCTLDGRAPMTPAAGRSNLYAPLAMHEGLPTRASDDIESLCYVLVFLATGCLPGQHQRHERFASMKRQIRVSSECGWAEVLQPSEATGNTLETAVGFCRPCGTTASGKKFETARAATP